MSTIGGAMKFSRRVQRALLATIVFVLTLALVQLAPSGGYGIPAFGQVPTPTPGAPTIQFINPSAGTSLEVSNKDDGSGDKTIHLVAWVSAIPENPVVEFKYKSNQSGSQEIPIGDGVAQVGPGDTFETNWTLGTAGPEGPDEPGTTITRGTSGVVKVILSSGSTEVSRDEETIRINEQTPPACPPPGPNNTACEDEAQANNVEMTYPTNGGPFGHYQPTTDQGPVNSLIDVTSSAETVNINAYYTLSRPGTEPSWKQCKAGTGAVNETRANTLDGIKCEYDPNDNPTRVTAVAVRATDAHTSAPGVVESVNVDGADAHRVEPYLQDPESIVLLPPTQEFESGKCAPVITARVMDQANPPRKVGDVNVDVHAMGPSDALSFDDAGGTYSTTNKAPENHPSESAVACEQATPGFSGAQGDHESAAEDDIKHIESLDDTNDAGEWKFALFSPDEGGTQFSVWADEDGNDRRCSEEAVENGSIGWDTSAPGPTDFAPEESSCPKPAPSGSPPPSATPTSSPSSSPSAIPSPGQRTLTLAAETTEATAGDTIKLSGQLFAPNNPTCVDNEFISITQRPHGARSAEPLTTASTDASGRYTAEITVRSSADYQAAAPAHDTCGEAFSSPVSSLVKVAISIRASNRTPTRGKFFNIVVRVAPNHRGTQVALFRKIFGRWIKDEVKKLNNSSRAVFKVSATFKRQSFRAKWRSQDEEHVGNTSAPIKVRPRKKARS